MHKYLDLSSELNNLFKNLFNTRVTVIPIVVGTLETIPTGLEKTEVLEICGIIETIQITLLVSVTEIHRRVLDT